MSDINLQLLSHGSRTPSHRCSAAPLTLDPAARQLPASPVRSSFSAVPGPDISMEAWPTAQSSCKITISPQKCFSPFQFLSATQREDGNSSFPQEQGITRISGKESPVACPKLVPRQPDAEEFLPALLCAKANRGRIQKHSLAAVWGCLSCKE